MPTTLANPGDSIAQMRFKEPYVSQGLNKKLFGLIGSGVVRGGKLQTTGAGFGLNIVEDAIEGDSIYSYHDVNGLQFTVRQQGTVTLDLTALAGQTVYICLFVGYSIGATTVVNWRAYKAAELFTAPVAEAPYVVILGKVVVPGVGPIPVANVTPEARRMAWDDKAPEGWHQVVKNGNFEQAVGAGLSGFYGTEHWLGSSFGTPNYKISTTAPYEGTREFQFEMPAPLATGLKLLYQEVVVRVEPGQFVRARGRMRGTTWGPIDPAGHQGVALVWLTNDFSVVSTTWVEDITLSGTFAYSLLDKTVEVPATAAWLRVGVGLHNNGAVLPAGSLFFDDIRVWVESEHPLEEMFEQNKLSESFQTEAVSFEPSFFDAPASMDDFIKRTIRFAKAAVGGSPAIDTLLGIMRGGDPFRLFLSQGQFRSDLWTAANFAIARFVGQWTSSGAVGANYTLLMLFGTASGAVNKIRFYARHGQYAGPVEGGDLNITINASWDGTNWNQDDVTRVSYRIRLSAAADVTGRLSGLSFFYVPAGFGPWADSNWKQTLNMGKAGDALEDAAIKFVVPTGYAGQIIQAMSGDVLGQPDFHISQRISDGALIISQNADWDPVGLLWNYDDPATTAAVRMVFLDGTISIERFNGAGPTWAEAAWTYENEFGRDASALASYLFIKSGGISATLNPGGHNRLFAENIPKMYGVIQTDGVGGVTIVDGYNIQSVSLLGGGAVRITFYQSFSSGGIAPYAGAAQTSGWGPSPEFLSYNSVISSRVDVTVYDAAGAVVNLNTNARTVDIIGIGHQS